MSWKRLGTNAAISLLISAAATTGMLVGIATAGAIVDKYNKKRFPYS